MDPNTTLAQDAFTASDSTANAKSVGRSGGVLGAAAKLGLALLGGLALGLAVHTAVGSGSVGTAWARVSQWVGIADPVQNRHWQPSPANEVVAHLPPGQARAFSLDASVLVQGERHSTSDGRIALPAGTRFQISVSAGAAGRLEIDAINSDGQSQARPLWSTAVQAGSAVNTPWLRLQGTRGLETLNLVLRSPQGDTLAERRVEIWHL